MGVLQTSHLLKTNRASRACPHIAKADVCNELGIKLIDGLGEKVQSS